MKKYFMSGARGKVHCSLYANGTCKHRIHSENMKEYDSLESLKNDIQKTATKCRICMQDVELTAEWDKVFGQ